MSKYDLLNEYLSNCREEKLTLTIKQIEDILGFKLPNTAYTTNAWWGNNDNRHVQAKSWLKSGYNTKDIKLGESVTFIKI